MKTSLLQRLQSHVAAILTPASARQNQAVDSGFIGVLQSVTSETAPLDNTLISTTNDIAIQGNENSVAVSPQLTPENPFIPTIQPESIPIEEAVHTSSIISNSDSIDEAKALDTQNVAVTVKSTDRPSSDVIVAVYSTIQAKLPIKNKR
ncbi:MAG: hypothetical protein IPM69_10820 [Ignavibacteria bacterium]|nr:hypothetical protein [Ignavibacteria bacterium]